MASPAGGYGGVTGSAIETHHQHHHGHMLLHSHAHHVAAAAAASGGQLYHVPQHSRREKLRFPPDAAAGDSPPTPLPPQHHHHHHQQQTGAWPPPAFYSYASSSSSYSPHSPTVVQGHLVPNGLDPHAQQHQQQQQLPQIPTQNFALSLSSASSNPATAPPTPKRQQLTGGPSTAAGPYGPFTGYATVLGRSRFLAPAQKLLEEICDVGAAAAHVDRSLPDEGLLDADPMDAADGQDLDNDADRAEASDAGPMSGAEQQWKKTKLISMMEEVCKRYRQYYQQVQAVIASFETVAGFSNAAPFAAMALRVMAKHFRHLKSMILHQLRNTSKMPVKEGMSKDITLFGLGGGGGAVGFQRGGSVNGFGQPHNIWRPQRGLPERSVTVLRAWLFEHFLHPYPTDGDKQMLAKQTGLTRNQVSNWFINARVRLWKPMVEEIHNLEMRQIHKHSPLDKAQHGIHNQTENSSRRTGKRSEPCDSQPGQSSSITRNHNTTTSHGFPDELSQMSHSIQGQVSFAGYSALSSQQHNMASPQHHHVSGAGNGGVSLTLGLHQNNRICFGEPLPSTIPANLAHRFGLEDVSDPYVMGSFGGQDRHFAKEIGGHLLHDFVG
uniref:BEL1-like homeodomain protein 9 n=1 Tax=Lolium perenne TaxID=4522 RepID=A0A516UX77_LOLPR|nr:BEL1-like homeodomain protein 9 [Lolium perenne]